MELLGSSAASEELRSLWSSWGALELWSCSGACWAFFIKQLLGLALKLLRSSQGLVDPVIAWFSSGAAAELSMPIYLIKQLPGSPWEPLGAPGNSWEPLGALGSPLEPLGALGSTWEPLRALGNPWEPPGAQPLLSHY